MKKKDINLIIIIIIIIFVIIFLIFIYFNNKPDPKLRVPTQRSTYNIKNDELIIISIDKQIKDSTPVGEMFGYFLEYLDTTTLIHNTNNDYTFVLVKFINRSCYIGISIIIESTIPYIQFNYFTSNQHPFSQVITLVEETILGQFYLSFINGEYQTSTYVKLCIKEISRNNNNNIITYSISKCKEPGKS